MLCIIRMLGNRVTGEEAYKAVSYCRVRGLVSVDLHLRPWTMLISTLSGQFPNVWELKKWRSRYDPLTRLMMLAKREIFHFQCCDGERLMRSEVKIACEVVRKQRNPVLATVALPTSWKSSSSHPGWMWFPLEVRLMQHFARPGTPSVFHCQDIAKLAEQVAVCSEGELKTP